MKKHEVLFLFIGMICSGSNGLAQEGPFIPFESRLIFPEEVKAVLAHPRFLKDLETTEAMARKVSVGGERTSPGVEIYQVAVVVGTLRSAVQVTFVSVLEPGTLLMNEYSSRVFTSYSYRVSRNEKGTFDVDNHIGPF